MFLLNIIDVYIIYYHLNFYRVLYFPSPLLIAKVANYCVWLVIKLGIWLLLLIIFLVFERYIKFLQITM